MRPYIRFILSLAGLLLIPAAYSQVEIGTIGKPPKDLFYLRDDKGEIKFSLKRYQGRIIVFYFWRVSNGESVDQLRLLNGMEKKMRDKGVRFVSMCPDEPEAVENFLKEKNLELFTGDKEVYNFYGPFFRFVQQAFGSMSHPECVVVDAYSNIVWRGHPADRLEDRIKTAIETSRPISGDAKRLEQKLRKADKLIDEKEYAKAYSLARIISLATNEDSQENSKAKSLMEKVEQKGAEWLKEARDAVATDKEKAAYIVGQLVVRLDEPDKELKKQTEGDNSNRGGDGNNAETKEGLFRDANNAMGEMFADRKLKELIRKAMENAEGEILIEQAQEYEDVDRYDEARVCYKQVMEKFKETPAAKTAETAFEKIRTDKKTGQALARARSEEEARRWLDLGDRFAKAELYPQAREHYERVIKEHGKSEFSKTAKDRLEKLPKATAKADPEKTPAADPKGKIEKP